MIAPAPNSAEAPDLNAFSDGKSAENPNSELGNPFAAPVSSPMENTPQAVDPAFNPYEATPETTPAQVPLPVPSFPEPLPEKSPAPVQDPLDLNLPMLPPLPEEQPTPVEQPGQASIEIPLAPPAGKSPNLPTQAQAPKLPAPLPLPEPNPLLQVPVPKPVLLVENAENATPPKPESGPTLDPLDQLTFPQAAPTLPTPSLPTPVEPSPVPEVKDNPFAAPPALEAPAQTPVPEITPRGFNPSRDPKVEAVNEVPAPRISSALPTPLGAPTVGSTPPPKLLEGVGVVEGAIPSGPQRPELKIEKTAPPKAALGQPMIYQILVRNVGQSAAHQVVVEDQVPKGSRLTGTIPRGEMADRKLIWRLGVIKPGEEKKIAVRVIPTTEGQIGSVAKVSFVAEVAARTVINAPKLALEFSGPESAVLGDALTYHFKVSNKGSGDAASVFLRNILPEGLKHPDGNDLEYEVGMLKAGETKEIDLTVNATKAGKFSNKAVVSAKGGLQKEAIAKVSIIGERLNITRTGPKRRYVGRLAAFSNTVANTSETHVAQVRVVEELPPGLDFVQASNGGKYDPQKRTVTWAIAELGPQKTQLLKLELMARKEGPQDSEVTAFDPNGTRAIVKSQTTVEGYTALRLDVKEYEEPLDEGEQVALRIVATNRGTRQETNVVVSITLPDEFDFVSAKGPVDYKRDGKKLTFNALKALNGRTEIEFDLVLKAIKAGDARLRLGIGSTEMPKPLIREEGVRILTKRP